MDFQNILVPTDGSDNTRAAIEKAFELARIAGGRITALYVKDKGSSDGTASSAVSKVSQLGEQYGVPVEERIESGSPAAVIAGMSSEFDVIVMGTLGRTGFKKVLVGSVAETVVKNAVCPVIVVRKTE
ncbi:Universal stress protein UspA-related nucleotide-binding protein [Thermoplasmatales archaeon BRNA1]|nr:Universal stress protein UspA-related nucleotide-binding protein [Thermoplasmatales archaeon BRNA1]